MRGCGHLTRNEGNRKRFVVAALISLGAVAVGAGVGLGISKIAGGNKPAPPKTPALPAPPNLNKANQKASEAARRRRATQTQTVYTSPLGIGGQAQVARKTLTGQ